MKSLYGNKCYSAIPAICEGNVLISDPKCKVNVFNEYFVSQATLSNNDSAEIPFLLRWSPDSISVITTDEQMVRHLLSTVNTSKACGCDGISNKIIRFCCEGLYKPFTSLINTSFRLGQYPSALKLAKLIITLLLYCHLYLRSVRKWPFFIVLIFRAKLFFFLQVSKWFPSMGFHCSTVGERCCYLS